MRKVMYEYLSYLSIAYFVSLFTSAIFYRRERKCGLISRSMVACVNSVESLFVHVLYQLPILGAQIAIIIAIPMFVFNTPTNGWWGWIAVLLTLGGFSGLSISMCSPTHVQTAIASCNRKLQSTDIQQPIKNKQMLRNNVTHTVFWHLITGFLLSTLFSESKYIHITGIVSILISSILSG